MGLYWTDIKVRNRNSDFYMKYVSVVLWKPSFPPHFLWKCGSLLITEQEVGGRLSCCFSAFKSSGQRFLLKPAERNNNRLKRLEPMKREWRQREVNSGSKGQTAGVAFSIKVPLQPLIKAMNRTLRSKSLHFHFFLDYSLILNANNISIYWSIESQHWTMAKWILV